MGHTLRKAGWHLALCLSVWFLVRLLAPLPQYAGWLAGLLGACYLLGGWHALLKTRGVDLAQALRRKKPAQPPYYLRGPEHKQQRAKLALRAPRHDYDDDGEERPMATLQEGKQRALAFALVGAALLALSLL